jgi:hypothetical protein
LDYLSRECEQTTAPDGTSVPSFGMCTLHTSTRFLSAGVRFRVLITRLLLCGVRS